MTFQFVRDPQTPVGDILAAAQATGVVLETQGQVQYAVLPLDEDLLDYLLERSPALIEDCRRIRENMKAGSSHSHADVRQMFADE